MDYKKILLKVLIDIGGKLWVWCLIYSMMAPKIWPDQPNFWQILMPLGFGFWLFAYSGAT